MLNPLVTGESRHVLHLKIVLKGKISFVRAKLVQLLKKFTFEKFFFSMATFISRIITTN